MSDTKVIINSKLDTPNGLGIDWIANNIYWTDNEYKVKKIQVKGDFLNIMKVCELTLPCFVYSLQVVEVARLDGTCRKTLVTGLTEPRALALFPAKGYVLITLDLISITSLAKPIYFTDSSIGAIGAKILTLNGLTLMAAKGKL